MKLIIGGAGQGKKEYVKMRYQLKDEEMMEAACLAKSPRMDGNCKCLVAYHLLVKKLLQEGRDPLEFTGRLIRKRPEIVIMMDEIGNGIIPLEKEERIWREQTGRVGCLLAAEAESVERVICGIPVKIKQS